jgi:DNA-binding transcriptional MerR regulator
MSSKYRLDDLARHGGVASTTVRLYQSRGLLAPPRLKGRTGWYDDSHLARLRLIARLQEDGHSLAGIANLLEKWEQGRGLGAVIGVEAEFDAVFGDAPAVLVGPGELFARFPAGSLSVRDMRRAVALGLVEPTRDGRLRIGDRRFLDTGSALAELGVPTEVILDEWEALVAHTDDIAERFITIFERHLVPENWERGIQTDEVRELATTLSQLQAAARTVLAAALDASLARVGRERLGELIER